MFWLQVVDSTRPVYNLTMIENETICKKARELGFDAAGVTHAGLIDADDIERFRKWLNRGCAGDMRYLLRNFDKRVNPAKLLDRARSVIVVALSYKIAAEPAVGRRTAKISRYAQFQDYHGFMKTLLRQLAKFIASESGLACGFKLCVDSVPLAERALAKRAGLGFIGKNHMLINPQLGPEVFLGEIITTAEVEPNEPAQGDCGDCRKCIEACPTGALSGQGCFDATRCISYLTIEHKGEIPAGMRAAIGDRLYGCDRCVNACPYWRSAPARSNKAFEHVGERAGFDPADVLQMTPEQFERMFSDSPIERLGPDRLKRNAQVCLDNIRSD